MKGNLFKKLSKKTLIISSSIIAVIVLFIGGFCLYQHFNDDDSDSGRNRKKDKTSDVSDNKSNDILDLTDYDSFASESTDGTANTAEDYSDAPDASTCTHLGVSHDENGDFQMLSGNFDTKINSQDDALKFIEDHSEEIGIEDSSTNLNFIDTRTNDNVTYYKFQQVISGVPVYGNQLIVSVNADGNAVAVNGTYTPVDINVNAATPKEKAEDLAKNTAGKDAEILESTLTILPHDDNGDAKLIYDINVIGNEKAVELFIDAKDGNIISENQLYSTATEEMDVNIGDSVYHVELEKIALNFYALFDSSRDILVSDASDNSHITISLTEGIFGGFNPLVAYKRKTDSNGNVTLDVHTIENKAFSTLISDYETIVERPMIANYSVTALSSTQTVYDYYNTNLNWKSFDGKGMPLKLIVAAKDSIYNKELEESGNQFIDIIKLILALLPRYKYVENAAYARDTNLIIFGAIDGKPLTGLGIVGHEFTHGVIYNIANLDSTVAASTINEGYADVMGSIISGDWEFMCNEAPTSWKSYDTSVRSAIDPHKFNAPAIKDSSDTYYKENPDDEHENATIVSHSAYLMTQNGLSDDQVAKIFFNSLFDISSHPDYEESALAVINAAYLNSFTNEELKAVADAFIETKMLEPEGKITVNVHCGKHAVPNASVTINGTEIGVTDDSGNITVDFDTNYIGVIETAAVADGFDCITQTVTLLGGDDTIDFNLAPNEDFGKTHGSDPDKKGDVDGEKVTVTMLQFATDDKGSAKSKAQEYYVQKGYKLSLQKLIDALGIGGITTDGTKIYYDTGIVPMELAFYVYGTDDLFDFNEPINEDVIVEPRINVGGIYSSNEDGGDGELNLEDFSIDTDTYEDLMKQFGY